MRKLKNRREHTRIPWEGTVTYRRSVPHRGSMLRTFKGDGEIRDISGKGLCLLTDERLAPKQFLSITVPVKVSGLTIPTLAYVQWTRPVRGTARYAAGLSFLA